MSPAEPSSAALHSLAASLLLLTSKIEVFALQLESMAVRYPGFAGECTELSGRMRAAVLEHRTAARAAIAAAGTASSGDQPTS